MRPGRGVLAWRSDSASTGCRGVSDFFPSAIGTSVTTRGNAVLGTPFPFDLLWPFLPQFSPNQLFHTIRGKSMSCSITRSIFKAVPRVHVEEMGVGEFYSIPTGRGISGSFSPDQLFQAIREKSVSCSITRSIFPLLTHVHAEEMTCLGISSTTARPPAPTVYHSSSPWIHGPSFGRCRSIQPWPRETRGHRGAPRFPRHSRARVPT